SWKVRTIPACAIWYERSRFATRPSNSHVPPFGRSKPVSRLNRAVLPAPFGPTRAVIVPRWTSRCSTSTATRPPRVRPMIEADRIGSGLAAPGSGGTSASASSAARCASRNSVSSRSVPLSDIEHQLPSVAEDALRPVDQQQYHSQAQQEEHQRPDLRAGEH